MTFPVVMVSLSNQVLSLSTHARGGLMQARLAKLNAPFDKLRVTDSVVTASFYVVMVSLSNQVLSLSKHVRIRVIRRASP